MLQDSRQSLGVRLALGETQLVAETRDFLLDHGVALDAFSQVTDANHIFKIIKTLKIASF